MTPPRTLAQAGLVARKPSPAPVSTVVTPSTEESKPAEAAPKTPVLSRTPVEVLVQVFLHLDMASAHNLAATSLRFATIFTTNRTAIVLHIARREFTPFDGLLQAVKASPVDMCTPWGTWLDKKIRRKNTVLCPGGTVPNVQTLSRIAPAEVQFGDWDVDKLLDVCRVVRGWERIFPQHRFNASPAMTRSLTPREAVRLRRALYTWMRYAFYFHGDLPRPNIYCPAGRDVRINFLRALSNTQLGALKDLWITVEDIVELNVCPSIDNVQMSVDGLDDIEDKDAARIGWGRARENRIVVSTVRKLSPREILFYLDNSHKYTKLRLIQDIRQRHPHFEADTESLSCALQCVVSERWRQMIFSGAASGSSSYPLNNALYVPVFGRVAGKSGGGILDWADPKAEADCLAVGEMTGLGLDWRPDEANIRTRPELPTGMLNP